MLQWRRRSRNRLGRNERRGELGTSCLCLLWRVELLDSAQAQRCSYSNSHLPLNAQGSGPVKGWMAKLLHCFAQMPRQAAGLIGRACGQGTALV